MKALAILAAVAIVVAAVSASAPRSAGCGALLTLPPAARAGEWTLYGHISSLTRKGPRFELRSAPMSATFANWVARAFGQTSRWVDELGPH